MPGTTNGYTTNSRWEASTPLPRARPGPLAVALGAVLVLGAGAGPPPRPKRPPEAPSSWPAEARSGFDLLRELIATDTTRRGGGRRGLQKLADALQVGAIRIEESSQALVATLPGSSPNRAPPILLLAHLDTWPADPAAWPDGLGPRSAGVRGGELYGRGVLGGKAAAALFASTLATLARRQLQRERPLWLVVTLDGLDPRAQSLERILGAYPALARTELALASGGFIVRRPRQNPPRLQAVAVGERGFALVQLTALGSEASIRLAEAVGALPGALPRVEVGASALRYLADLSAHVGGIEAWLMRSPPLARLLYTGSLARDPATRSLVRTETRVVFGGSEGPLGADSRARAWVQAFLPDREDPAGLSARLRAKLGHRVHVDLYDGEPILEDLDQRLAFAQIAGAFGGSGWVRVIGEPSQARLLIRIGVPLAGFLPMEVSAEHLRSRAGPLERVPLQSVRLALRLLPRALEALLGRPNEGSRTSTLAGHGATWHFAEHRFIDEHAETLPSRKSPTQDSTQ